jgi:hypothetical protein
MQWTAPIQGNRDVAFWLQGDLQPPEIDFRSTPNNGHSEAHAGLPLTQPGHRTVPEFQQGNIEFEGLGVSVTAVLHIC